jgi:hypothetical protein
LAVIVSAKKSILNVFCGVLGSGIVTWISVCMCQSSSRICHSLEEEIDVWEVEEHGNWLLEAHGGRCSPHVLQEVERERICVGEGQSKR